MIRCDFGWMIRYGRSYDLFHLFRFIPTKVWTNSTDSKEENDRDLRPWMRILFVKTEKKCASHTRRSHTHTYMFFVWTFSMIFNHTHWLWYFVWTFSGYSHELDLYSVILLLYTCALVKPIGNIGMFHCNLKFPWMPYTVYVYIGQYSALRVLSKHQAIFQSKFHGHLDCPHEQNQNPTRPFCFTKNIPGNDFAVSWGASNGIFQDPKSQSKQYGNCCWWLKSCISW